MVKAVLLGDINVGKTSFLLRFVDDYFNDNYIATVGVDFRFRNLKIDDKNVKVQLWDTAGQEKYRSFCNIYYKGADLIIILFDKSNRVFLKEIIRRYIYRMDS